jgi:hypothetical protein
LVGAIALAQGEISCGGAWYGGQLGVLLLVFFSWQILLFLFRYFHCLSLRGAVAEGVQSKPTKQSPDKYSDCFVPLAMT